jgi:hypothetical protein
MDEACGAAEYRRMIAAQLKSQWEARNDCEKGQPEKWWRIVADEPP